MILNLNPFILETLQLSSIEEMYYRAKYIDNVKFNHFYEWISNDVNQAIYSHDRYFEKLESQYKAKIKR